MRRLPRIHLPRPDLRRVEQLVAVAGAALMSYAVSAVDWRAGLFFAGVVLVAATVDLKPRRVRK